MSVTVEDVAFHCWGVVVTVRRTKTISFGERVLEVPLVCLPGSPFCIYVFLSMLLCKVGNMGSIQLISYGSARRLVRGTYSWFSSKLKMYSQKLGLQSCTTHSLRRGGASAMFIADIPIIDIRNLGDWKSLYILRYLSCPLEAKIDLDRKIADRLFFS